MSDKGLAVTPQRVMPKRARLAHLDTNSLLALTRTVRHVKKETGWDIHLQDHDLLPRLQQYAAVSGDKRTLQTVSLILNQLSLMARG